MSAKTRRVQSFAGISISRSSVLQSRTISPGSRRNLQDAVKVGDTVEILSMGVSAEVIAVSDDRQLTLQAGIMKVSAREDEVFLLENQKKKKITVPV